MCFRCECSILWFVLISARTILPGSRVFQDSTRSSSSAISSQHDIPFNNRLKLRRLVVTIRLADSRVTYRLRGVCLNPRVVGSASIGYYLRASAQSCVTKIKLLIHVASCNLLCVPIETLRTALLRIFTALLIRWLHSETSLPRAVTKHSSNAVD